MHDLNSARYQCGKCITTRDYTYERETHYSAVESSPNGLVLYSDIHRCENGFLGINNLHIDRNNAIRSFEHLILPSEKKMRISLIPGLPAPTVKKEEITLVDVTQMLPNYEGFRMIIVDHDLKIKINLGRVQKSETLQFTVTSPLNGVTLEYYPSPEPLSNNLKAWFVELISLIETLPPTKIGLFIDTLRYIYSVRKIDPTPFHLNLLKTILTSHKVFFEVNDGLVDLDQLKNDFNSKYGDEPTELMIKLVDYIISNPGVSLQNYTKSHHEEISHLIYIFLTLEQEEIIKIIRPNGLDASG